MDLNWKILYIELVKKESLILNMNFKISNYLEYVVGRAT